MLVFNNRIVSLTIAAMFLALCLVVPAPASGFEYDVGNGNRDYYADDERGLAYVLDRIYSRFVAYDWSGNEVYFTGLLGAPMSMDLSLDGSKAYIACDGAQRISVVDLDLRTTVDDMALDFVPHGIACGEGSTVFISSLNDNLVRKVDVSTDIVIWTKDIGMSSVLIDIKLDLIGPAFIGFFAMLPWVIWGLVKTREVALV